MVKTMVIRIAGFSSFNIWLSPLRKMQDSEQLVDEPDSGEGNQDAPQPVDQQIAPQQGSRRQRAILHSPQRQRDQGDDDQSVENDRGEDRALRGVQSHDV